MTYQIQNNNLKILTLNDRSEVNTSTYGVLYLKKPLNFEDVNEYKVTINSFNKRKSHKGKKLKSVDNCKITIKVNDVNEAPIFDEETFQRSILEGSEVDVDLGEPITARDPEQDKFEFELKDQNLPFRIDKQLGTLFVAGRLDREEREKYNLIVIGMVFRNNLL